MRSGGLHGQASVRGCQCREIGKGEAHAVFSLSEFIHLIIMASGAGLGRAPGVSAYFIGSEWRESSLWKHFGFTVMFEEEAGSEWGVIVIVMTTGGVTGVVCEVFVRIEILKGDFMAVSAEVRGYGYCHFTRNFMVMFTVTGDAVKGINVIGEDGILGVFKFTNGVRVGEFFKGFPVAIHARGRRNA